MARKTNNALSTQPAANSTASSLNLSPEPTSYPQIPRTKVEGQHLIVGLVLTREVLFVFLIAFCVLLALWPFGFVAFHVAGGLIHLLLVIAVISLIVHFTRAHG